MRIIVLAQNIPYLVSIGVPEANAQAILDHLNSIDKKDRGKVLRQVKSNPTISLEELKQFKIFTTEEKEKVKEEKYSDIPQEILEWAKGIAPNYLDWMLKQIKNESVHPKEDDDIIKSTLKRFESLKRKRDFPKENKDINQYKTFGELTDLLARVSGDFADNTSEPEIDENDPDIIYNENSVVVLKIMDPQKAERLAANTGGVTWCVGRGHTGYTPPLYLVLIDDFRVMLIHHNATASQFKVRNNTGVQDYNLVKILAPIFDKLGIGPNSQDRSDQSYDGIQFNSIREYGDEINSKIETADDKRQALNDLQAQKVQESINAAIGSRTFGDGITGQSVLFFLDDAKFEDPQVKEYALSIYKNVWQPRLATVGGINTNEFYELYKKIPNAMKLMGGVREINKNNFLLAFKQAINEYGNNNPYRETGRELKVMSEIQNAYKDFWKDRIIKDPNEYLSKDIPPRFKKEFKGLYVKSILHKIEEGPYAASGDYHTAQVSYSAFEKAPDEIKAMPEIKEAYRKGWLNLAHNRPYLYHLLPADFKNDTEFIGQNKEGWISFLLNMEAKDVGKIYAKIPANVKSDPNYEIFKVRAAIPYYQAVLRKDPKNYIKIPPDLMPERVIYQTLERMVLVIMRDNPASYFKLPVYLRSLPRIEQIEQKVYIPIWLKKANEDRIFYDVLSPELKERADFKKANENAWQAAIEVSKKEPVDRTPITYTLTDVLSENTIATYTSMPSHIRTSPRAKIFIEKRVVPAYLNRLNSILITSEYNVMLLLPSFFTKLPPEIFVNATFFNGCKKLIINYLNGQHDAFQIRQYLYNLPDVLTNDPDIKATTRGKIEGQNANYDYDQKLKEKQRMQNKYLSGWYGIFKESNVNPILDKIEETNKELEELDKELN